MQLLPLQALQATEELYLCSKAFHMVLLRVQSILRDKHGKVCILDPNLLDLCIEESLNGLPHMKSTWAQDVAACMQPAHSRWSYKAGSACELAVQAA